jgi:hypothetical protein
MNPKILTTSTLTAALLAACASACDFCGCELPLITLQDRKGWYAGAAEQATRFGTLQSNGHDISDPDHQYLHSSNTQIFVGYDFGHTFGVQINVPLITRSYRRAEGDGIQKGNVSGFGDVSLLAHWTPLHFEKSDFLLTGRVVAGIQFPTGDSNQVLEEANESEDEEGEGSVPSGIHGHDLALGTGSVNGIFGADIHAQWKRVFLDAGVQFALRGQGRNEYDFANDLGWYAGLGVVAFEKNDLNFAIKARFSGDTKGEDTFRGVRSDDTASTVVWLGPEVVATWRDRVSVDVGVAFPIYRDNTGVQTVADIRVQAGVTIQF